MEPTPDNRVRKRRRWLIVAFVLVLVSLCSWWFWPRGDARLVGRWQCTLNELVWPRQPEKKWEWRFDVSGRVRRNGDDGRDVEATWEITEGLLFLYDPQQPFESVVRRKAERILMSLTGKQLDTTGGFKIIAEGPDRILLQQIPYNREFRLRRIPE